MARYGRYADGNEYGNRPLRPSEDLLDGELAVKMPPTAEERAARAAAWAAQVQATLDAVATPEWQPYTETHNS